MKSLALASTVAAVAALGGCGGGDSGTAGPTGPALPGSDPTAALTVPPVQWQPCANLDHGDDCAKVKVPLDYAQPGGQQIELEVARLRATDASSRIGSLVISTGAWDVAGGALGWRRKELKGIRARFDLVVWDYRGSGGSARLDCKAMPTMPQLVRTYDHTPGTAAKEMLKAAHRQWAEQCKANAGAMLPFISMSATGFDLEVLRRATGDAKLTFLGVSGGTDVGLLYLSRYPERVRAMVLDSPGTIWRADYDDLDQPEATQAALTAFLDWCQKAQLPSCPFARNMSRATAFDELLQSLKRQPIATSKPGKTLDLIRFSHVLPDFVAGQYRWPDLSLALENARMGDGTRLFDESENLLGPEASSDWDGGLARYCGDNDAWTDERIEARAAKVKDRWYVQAYSDYACVGWPVSNRTAEPGPLTNLPPIVLSAGTGDSFTPYKWAVAIAKRLPGSRLFTQEAYGHTSYGYGHGCVDPPIDDYLINLTLPPPDARCVHPLPRPPEPRDPFPPSGPGQGP